MINCIFSTMSGILKFIFNVLFFHLQQHSRRQMLSKKLFILFRKLDISFSFMLIHNFYNYIFSRPLWAKTFQLLNHYFHPDVVVCVISPNSHYYHGKQGTYLMLTVLQSLSCWVIVISYLYLFEQKKQNWWA